MSRKILEYEKLSRTGVSDDGTLLYNGNSRITISELKAIIGACAPTDNYDVNRIILACSTMDINEAIPLALPDGAKFRLYVNRDDSGTFTDLEIENADDSGEVHALEHGYNWIYWSSLDVAMNLYVNIGVLEDNFITPEDVIEFAFTSATTNEASIALMTALYGIYSAENGISISFERVDEAKEAAQEAQEVAQEAKEMADDTMIDTDDIYNHYAQVLIRDANGNEVDAETLKGITLKKSYADLTVNGLVNNNCMTHKYFKARSKEGLIITGYIANDYRGGYITPKRFVPTKKTIDPQANVALIMYEELIGKIDQGKQVEQAQNNIMCNYLMKGTKPTMVYREVGDTHYTVDYEKKWADDKNLFKGSSGGTWKALQDVLLLDCTGMSSLQNAFTVSGGYSTRNLRSVCGICNFDNVTSFNQMFYNAGYNIETIQFAPKTVVKNKVDVSSMFACLRAIKSVNIDEIVFEGGVTKAKMMFVDCFKLEKVKFPAMPGLTDCTYMFSQCNSLRSIDATNLDFSTITGFDLGYLPLLEDVIGVNGRKESYSIGDSPLLTYESAINCINGLYDLTEGGTVEDYTPQTLTLHENVYAQLEDADIAVAVEKGWSVVES